MKKLLIGLILCAAMKLVSGQDDSLFHQTLDELVVTATRSERKLGNVAVPVTLVNQQQIRESGSLRLDNILKEQTGLVITQNFGNGIQMQGLSPDYTLILIDGEPLIGRTGGVLDLSRIAIGNIKRIEIVKGPSSSLYGSEAMGGVINIITDRSSGNRLNASLRYGRFNTIDGSVQGAIKLGKISLNGFLDSYSSDGYSLVPNSTEKTVEPFWKFTQQWQARYTADQNTSIGLSFRHNLEQIQNKIAVENNGAMVYSEGKTINRDLNINPSLVHRFNEHLKTSFRGYLSQFESEQNLSVKDLPGAYNDYFKQEFYRIENQTDILLHQNLSFNVGGGFIQEYVRSNRYDSTASKKSNQVGYVFLQAEWKPLENLTLIPGVRYDDNKAYASVWSPKMALQYKFNDRLWINASIGRGFKAPDFRQLYLNFTNIAAGSYSVFGSLVAQDEVNRLQGLGQIDYLLPSFYKLKDLKPETSTGINLGGQYFPLKNIGLKLNFFRNDIDNLILTDIIAYKTNGGQIYSYLNIDRVFTQGLETEISWQLLHHWTFAAGYQYLQTADKDVLEEIKSGKVFTRDQQTGISYRLSRNEYGGLPGRSKHNLNLKAFFESIDSKWFVTTRLLYRSRWGTTDIDGNGIINREDEYAPGYLQVNISGGRNFRNGLQVMAGVDNLLNYKDPEHLPGLPGATWYAMVSYNFLHRTTSENL